MSNIFDRIGNALSRVFGFVRTVFNATNKAAGRFAPVLREFVVETADRLETLIPDGGMGNIKLMAFDGALKLFVDEMRKEGELDDEEVGGVWEFAHVLLEGHLAAKKAAEKFKKES